MSHLKNALDQLITESNNTLSLSQDPLQFAHRYHSQTDQEIAGVLASILAFGRVRLFLPVINQWLDIADQNGGPTQFVLNFQPTQSTQLQNLQYRWHKHPDFALMILALQDIYQNHPTLEAIFVSHYKESDSDLMSALGFFITNFRQSSLRAAKKLGFAHDTYMDLPASYRRFLPSPLDGSACKKWQMFLRWMIRQSSPDLGLWNLPPHKLCIPLDTHIHSISLMLGLTKRQNADLKCAQEITTALRQFEPNDPIKYDFALAHLGISGTCQKEWDPNICPSCPLHDHCIRTKSLSNPKEK